MNILVLGWYNHHNIGDESYRTTFPIAFPGNTFRFVEKITEEDLNWSEIVILGGGNILKKHFLNEIKKVKNKQVIAFSVGAESDLEKNLPLKHIYARDKKTVEICTAAGYPCTFCPDLGMYLTGDSIRGKELLVNRSETEKFDLYSKTVIVVINGYLMGFGPDSLSRSEYRFNTFSYEFARVADETCASFIFVPFGTSIPCDDRLSNAFVASKCKFWKKNHVIFDRISVQDSLDMISCSDLVISSRLHSSIFSSSCGVPFIDITHHSKNSSFLDISNNQEASMNYWRFSYDKFIDQVKSYIERPKNNNANDLKLLLRGITDGLCLSK